MNRLALNILQGMGLEGSGVETADFLFHIALYPVFEVGYMCVDCVELRIALALVVSEAHQSQEPPQAFARPLPLYEGVLLAAGLVLRGGRQD